MKFITIFCWIIFSTGLFPGEIYCQSNNCSASVNDTADKLHKYLLKGDEKRFRNDFNGALLDYNKALKLFPRHHEIFIKKAITYSLMKDFGNSIRNYNIAIKNMPENSTAWCGRGFVKVLLKEYKDAIVDFSNAIKLDPSYVAAYLGKGISEEALGNHENSSEDFKKVKELDSLKSIFDPYSDPFELPEKIAE